MVNLRYLDYVPVMGRAGAVPCVSGRTAVYRRSAVMPVLEKLENEFFLGRRCVAGDDGRLSWLVLAQGYRTVHQSSARALSMFPVYFRSFVKQRVRWSRNSFRCYLTAIFKGWLWRQPLITQLTVLQIMLTPVTMGVTLTYLVLSRLELTPTGIGIAAAWLLLGRGIRGISHLRKHPRDILLLPLMTLVACMVALPIKAYAFVTMNKQGWLTRHAHQIGGDGQDAAALLRRRLPRENLPRRLPADRRVLLRLALDCLGNTERASPSPAQTAPGQEYAPSEGRPYSGNAATEPARVDAEDARINDVRSMTSTAAWRDVDTTQPYRLPTGRRITLVLVPRERPYDMAELAEISPSSVKKQSERSYLVQEHVVVLDGATLTVTADQRVRLASDSTGFSSVVTLGGTLACAEAPRSRRGSSPGTHTRRPPTPTPLMDAGISSSRRQVVITDAQFSDLGFWSGGPAVSPSLATLSRTRPQPVSRQRTPG